MPEHPEVHAFARYIANECMDMTFLRAWDACNPKPYLDTPFKVKADARGKQLRLRLTPLAKGDDEVNNEVSLIISLGLLGYVDTFLTREEALRDDGLLFLEAEDALLAFCTRSPETFRVYVGEYDFTRSPDPVYDYEAYVENFFTWMLQRSRRQIPRRTYLPVCRFLLEQRLFNGVGNYLRAEILHRLKLHPFQDVATILRPLRSYCVRRRLEAKTVEFTPDDLLEVETRCPLVPMVRKMCLEAAEVVHDPQAFGDWLQCYQKAPNSLLDSSGRKIWFYGDKELHRHVIDEGEEDETRMGRNYASELGVTNHSMLERLLTPAARFQNSLQRGTAASRPDPNREGHLHNTP
ncbi:Endonuclease VIII-like 1 [Giardia muris]|uniref:DNA-formamidopyrimidine glycosylase n=1 Tax=Giardia muris TaxID=5742 RepID=A0A4Z1SRF0_GIAMU|nr:Endonuclease VIII-like 1 [Giardia muris]|eukprot:TNJ27545.1 Endonuclease VIII-like 1 [Giardia muris]